ncbi:MAG: TRAP transporter substrate-binding protein DctP [Spirochaetes bacterium]|uniref:TRAP transporter substrate-binding protein DctP n=1 Tax=Candidatus Avitreponema avistercoris TaxID=2840705 RepID=A0A9D9HI11_9SPIR|nr:TRAP transporter substrate-binding protein DctP [Candidatus Avitreponema avistercoris]
MKAKTKKRFILCLLLAGTVLACAAQERVQLKIASLAPARSPWDIQLKELAQEWYEITDGAVSVTYYDTNSLGGERSVLQKLNPPRPGQKPPLDGAVLSTIGLNEMAPAAHIYTLSIPFLIRSQAELDQVLDTYGGTLLQEFDRAGFKVIAWTNVGWLSFYTKDPYRNLQELSAIKLASAGLDSPVLGEVFRAAGLTVENIQSTKILQSLKSSGGVRGFSAVHLYAYVTGYYKGIQYALNTKMCPVMAGLVISNSAWERIPEQYKPALIASVERVKQQLNNSLDESDALYVSKMEEEGVTMINPTAEELSAWERDFSRAVEAVNRSVPDAFDMELFRNIQTLLREN